MSGARALLVACAAACAAAGCSAPVIIASAGVNAVRGGTAAFVRGEMQAAARVTLEEAWLAATQAVHELQFDVRRQRLEPDSASISARESGGRSIRIELIRKSPVVTKMTIRVGLLGDQAVSRVILAEIQANLLDPGSNAPAVPMISGDPLP